MKANEVEYLQMFFLVFIEVSNEMTLIARANR